MMISKFRKFRVALIAAAVAVTAAAQIGAQGLPGEFLITDRWRHIYSQHSGITNPAFINEENYMSLRFLFANTLEEFNTMEAGFTMPLGLYDAVGLAWMMQGAGAFAPTDNDGNPIPGADIRDNTNFFAASYARNVWGGLTVGANANFIMQSVPDIPGENAVGTATRIGFGLDVGLTYKLVRHQMLGNHILGLSTTSIFNMMLDTDEKFASALRFSLLSDFWERRVYFGTDFVLKDLLTSEDEFNATKNMPWELTHKLGGNILRIFKLYLLAGFSPEGFDHYGFAFGANMPGFFNGRDIEGMVQFVWLGNSDATHLTFYARTELGKHREEIYARNMARRGTLGPNNLYNQALELYYRGEYFRAYWIFSQIAVEYPDFFRSDMVSFYQAASLEGMDMRQSAVSSFRRTKEEHSRSIAVPLADLGLMRVFYRSGDMAAVESQFNELNALGVPDSIKFHAYYIMGQASIQRNDFARARQLFTMIPEDHPDYVFAYHSAAVANMMDDNIQGAIADLEFVVQMTPKNKSQEEIINRSFVFLGLLYYEDLQTEGALARAVTALRRVPKNSYYYQEALLGLGWTALKARQWADCIAAGQELVRSSTNPILQSEGNLIHAYALAMQRQFTPAVTLLDEARKRLAEYTPPTESELARSKNEYNVTRGDYEGMGVKIDELGQARQSSIVQASIDSLQAPQSRSKSSIDQHLKFEDEFRRNSFFARNFEQVKEDIDYALARFTRYAGTGGAREAIQRRDGDAEAIDDELRRLQEELKGE